MIEIAGLTKAYGSQVVLDDIDFTVEQAQIAAVVGPSGAGKSTLARCVNLLDRPTSGTITVKGQELTNLSRRDLRAARRQIGTVFQSASLLRRLTAAQNVALPLRYLGLPDREIRQRTAELLDRVGMMHRANHYPSQLSGGQRQRIGIARGLALRPSVLLSDEATSGLDPEATRSILQLLAELRDDLGVTIVVITHEMDVVRAVADVVAHLEHGRIVESGPVEEVVRRSNSALSQAILPLPPALPAGDQRRWGLRYEGVCVPANWPATVGRLLGSEPYLIAALVEQVGPGAVGRLTVGLRPDLDERRVQSVFASLGIHAEPSEPSEPSEPGDVSHDHRTATHEEVPA